jgi:hypothetical protein
MKFRKVTKWQHEALQARKVQIAEKIKFVPALN